MTYREVSDSRGVLNGLVPISKFETAHMIFGSISVLRE